MQGVKTVKLINQFRDTHFILREILTADTKKNIAAAAKLLGVSRPALISYLIGQRSLYRGLILGFTDGAHQKGKRPWPDILKEHYPIGWGLYGSEFLASLDNLSHKARTRTAQPPEGAGRCLWYILGAENYDGRMAAEIFGVSTAYISRWLHESDILSPAIVINYNLINLLEYHYPDGFRVWGKKFKESLQWDNSLQEKKKVNDAWRVAAKQLVCRVVKENYLIDNGKPTMPRGLEAVQKVFNRSQKSGPLALSISLLHKAIVEICDHGCELKHSTAILDLCHALKKQYADIKNNKVKPRIRPVEGLTT